MRAARKRFGQHFLEAAWAAKVVRAAAPESSDVFLEIGPGRGALTRPLAAKAARVIAVEIDRGLAADLAAADVPGLTVLPRDFLAISGSELRTVLGGRWPENGLRVAGNLPYNVASPILFHLVDLRGTGVPLKDATVMVQREVADRLLARPGTRDYGVLTVLIGLRARVERRLDLPPGAFRPAPRVRSTVVQLTFHDAAPPVADPARFEALVKAIFTQRRKTLANALAAHLAPGHRPAAILAAANVDGRRRPETLDLEELARLSEAARQGDDATAR